LLNIPSIRERKKNKINLFKGGGAMEFHFTFKGMDSSPAIAEYAEKKFSKLEKYFYGPVHAQVLFKREKFREICEVILTGDGERIVVKERQMIYIHPSILPMSP
jgi:hypothetical protein